MYISTDNISIIYYKYYTYVLYIYNHNIYCGGHMIQFTANVKKNIFLVLTRNSSREG